MLAKPIRFLCSILFLLLYVVSAGCQTAPTRTSPEAICDLLWKPGDQLGAWTVQGVTVHPEFVRWQLAAQGHTTAIEVVSATGRTDRTWCSAHLCVQPAPGQQPPQALVRAALQGLGALDGQRAGPAQPVLAAVGAGTPGARDPSWWWLCTLNLLCWLGSAALAGWWWRSGRARAVSQGTTVDAGFAALVLFGLPLTLLAVRASVLPVDWVTVLHEGGSAQDVAVALGDYGHGGPNLAWLAQWATPRQHLDAGALVARNLALWAFDVAGLTLLVWPQLRGRGALVFGALLAWHPVAQLAASSESEAAAVTAVLVLSAPALRVLARPGPVTDGQSLAAWLLLAACSVSLLLTRTETAGVLLAAGLWHAARARLGDPAVGGLARKLGQRWHRAPWPHKALLASILVAISLVHGLPPRWGWLVQGLLPLQPSVLALPVLIAACVGAGLTVLAAAGVVALLRGNWLAWGWAPIVAVVLFRVWFAASHRVFFEMVRYCVVLVPWVAVAAALGARWLLAVARVDKPGRRAVAALAVVGCAAAPPVPQAAAWVWDWRPGALDRAPLLDFDQQAEVRFILRALQQSPHCTFVTPVHLATERKGAALQVGHVVYSARGGAVRHVPGDLNAALRQLHAEQSPCIRLLQGLDCNLVVGPSCPGPGPGWQPLAHVRRPRQTWSDPTEYGQLRDPLDLYVLAKP